MGRGTLGRVACRAPYLQSGPFCDLYPMAVTAVVLLTAKRGANASSRPVQVPQQR